MLQFAKEFVQSVRGAPGFALTMVVGGLIYWSINTDVGNALIARLMGR